MVGSQVNGGDVCVFMVSRGIWATLGKVSSHYHVRSGSYMRVTHGVTDLASEQEWQA